MERARDVVVFRVYYERVSALDVMMVMYFIFIGMNVMVCFDFFDVCVCIELF